MSKHAIEGPALWTIPEVGAISADIPPRAASYLNQSRETLSSPSASVVMSASAVDAMLPRVRGDYRRSAVRITKFFFGNLPIKQISGFKDELSGAVITNAFTTGIFDANDVYDNWQPLASLTETPQQPLMTLTGLIGYARRINLRPSLHSLPHARSSTQDVHCSQGFTREMRDASGASAAAVDTDERSVARDLHEATQARV
jgi:hypothetical protein